MTDYKKIAKEILESYTEDVEYDLEWLEGIEEEANERNFGNILCNVYRKIKEKKETLNILQSKNKEGKKKKRISEDEKKENTHKNCLTDRDYINIPSNDEMEVKIKRKIKKKRFDDELIIDKEALVRKRKKIIDLDDE
jgi:hypothetical protein